MMDRINLGEPATIEYTVKEDGAVKDISSATKVELKFTQGAVEQIVDAQFATDGTDGKIKYVVTASVLDAVGVWEVRARITVPSAALPFGADPDTIRVEKW